MRSQKDLQIPARFQKRPSFESEGPTLLLVEDEPSVLKATRRMLEHLGYRVLTANQGEEALAIFEAHQTRIDLILTDLTLPGLSGMELAEAIRNRDPQAKVVALTGHAFNLDEVELSNPNVIDWIQKPFDLQGLAYMIERSLSARTKPERAEAGVFKP